MLKNDEDSQYPENDNNVRMENIDREEEIIAMLMMKYLPKGRNNEKCMQETTNAIK